MPIDSTDVELDYRAKNYPDLKAIERKRIACATCGKNLSAKIEKPGGVFVHPFTTTLQCKKCSDFYGDGDFSMDEDGDDKYCRICGNGGELYICGNKPCPYGFCQKCINRYIGTNSTEVQADDWKCLHCNCKPLWEVRAICAVIILENSKKLRKHKKYATRGEVYVSDDNCSRSEDLDSDFQSSNRATHRALRYSRSMRTKIKSQALDRLAKFCDSSNDSSVHGDLPQKSTAGRRDSTTKSKPLNIGMSQTSSSKRNGAGPSRGRRRLSESEVETSEPEEKQIICKKQWNSKFPITSAELKSKSVTSNKHTKQTSSKPHRQHRETLHHSQKNRIAVGSRECVKHATRESDSESSHESANDFFESKKKKNLRMQLAESNKKNSTVQEKSFKISESLNSHIDPNRLDTKFGKVVQDRKMHQSSSELRSTNTIIKEIDKRDNYTSEGVQEMDIPNKKGKLRVKRKNQQSSDSESELDSKICEKSRKPPTAKEETEQSLQTKRLSIKPLYPTTHPLSSFEYNNWLLDRRKAAIKRSYAKLSPRDCVTKDQAKILKNRVGNLVTEMRLFGKSLCAGVNGIATEHLTSNVTSVPAVSKIALKCALLMIRCKTSLHIIEHEFIESYEKWCRSSKVTSLFSEMDDVRSTASNQAESIVKENSSDDNNREYRTSRDSEETRDNLLNQSNTSDDDGKSIINDELACSTFTTGHKIVNARRDTRQKSVNSDRALGNPNNSEKIHENVPDHENTDSDKDSRNSRRDAMSDCDGEIFSDYECRAQTNETTQPMVKKICVQSPSSNASDKQSIESHSDDLEKVEPTKSKKVEEKSLQSENVMGGLENVVKNQVSITQSRQADNQAKLVECSAQKSSNVPSRVENPSEDMERDVSVENSSKDTVSSECRSTSDLIEKSRDLKDDQSVSNDFRTKGNVSTTEKSALPETEVNVRGMNDTKLLDHDGDDNDDGRLDFWDKSMANKRKSKTLGLEQSSLTNIEEDVGHLSDCDETIIFTQSPYNHASTNSDEDDSSKSPEEKLAATENVNMSGVEIQADAEMSLENEVNCADVASLPKPSSKSPETVSELHKGATDLNDDKNMEPHGPKTCTESTKRGNVTQNRSIVPSSGNNGNHSRTNGNAPQEDGTGETDPDEKQAATVDDDSEEAIKNKILESDFESSEDNDRNQASPVDHDSREKRKRKCLESDSECSDDHEIKAAVPVDGNSSKVIEKKILESSEDYEQKQATPTDNDSEEAIKKKMLGSDSEWSEESLAISSNFKLKMISDSDENTQQAVPADTALNIVPSKMGESEKETEQSEIDPMSPGVDVSALNNLAKKQLLSSSDSSSSDADNVSLSSPANVDLVDSLSESPQESEDVDSSSDIERASTSTTFSRTKKLKFNLEKNVFYQTDKKLQIECQVVVRRLNEKVLDQFRQLLGKSRKRQEREDFESLIDLKSMKKRKRGTRETNPSGTSSESESSKTSSKGNVKKSKSKPVQEKEETLLEHLEKMKNGESYYDPLGDETDDNTENNDNLRKLPQEQKTGEEFLAQANKLAKAFLIQSSDSENEMQASVENTQEQEQQEQLKSEKAKEKKKDKDISNEKAVDSEGNHENGSNAEKDNDEETANAGEDGDSKQEEDSDSSRTREKKKLKDGLAKRNWRLTDSDSSDEEEKWNKSQQKKSEEKSTEPKEQGSKRKKKVKRRVLGSDSDSVKLTEESDDSVEVIETKKNSSSDSEDSGELFKNLRTKRRRKRNSAQKTDSDSESEQDEKQTKQKRKRIKKMASDSDSDALTNSQDTPGKLHRKNIRKVLKDKQVADVTKIAGKEEEERLKRIAERQKLYNEMYEMKLASEAKVDKLVLDFDEETKKELVSVHEGLVKRLKPHQAQGIKFMWDACFESLERIKTEKGSGCIVAHCMGLGKTFQVVTLAHTLLTHPETGIKTIMVICPLSTVLNWVNEFKKWLGDINNDEDVEVFEMTKMKKNFERKYQLEKWHRAGGVMVLGYEMFRLLSNQTGKKMRKSLHEGILKCLVDPGPDLIVCDEGHLLKNEDTALSKAMRRVKTLRRIVLTGTPLQNNLVEYHCMVQFVKPNLLGTKKEFLNRFVNPITNGQFDDSTEYDVKLMKKRAHVLHKMLEGSVQRFDYSVLTPFLPPKQEYVITVRLADIQIQLYQHYLDHYSRKKVGAGTSLFADFQALQRIWTHPIVLRMNAEKMEKINEKKRMDASDTEGSLVDFLDDGSSEKTTSSSDSDVRSASSSEEKKEKPRRGTRANPALLQPKEEEEELQPQLSGEWWNQFVEPHHFEDMKISSKLVLLFAILKECEQIGDKVLVFSQSLYALSLIEEFLNKIDDETQRGTCSELIDEHNGSWSLGLDYFRLDGQTPPENRSHYCRIFNNPKNSRARLFLISTRAGGLGINLTAANRVIIFDASWNPSHDVQSIFRIYRFGQKKPCYVYRFLAQGTMEEKIYNRQVTKLSLSCRVVDEQQIERHYSNHDLAELYQFEPKTSKEKPTLNLPKDRLLAEILRKYEDRVETIHEHDSLLENKAEEELDEEERKEAWKEYEDERTGRKVMMNNFAHQNFAMQQYDMMNMNPADIANRATLSGINIDTLQALIRKDYPNSTPEQQTFMTQRAIMDMYTYMESEAIRQQQLAASSYTYPTVSNIGTSSFVDGNVTTPAQRQYALQQQQLHQIMVQREQQANYAKRYGNVRGPALAATPTRTTQPPVVVNLQEDNDIIEIPTSPPVTTGPVASSSVQQMPPASAPAASKRQEE